MKKLLAHFRRKPSEPEAAPTPPAEAPKTKALPIEPMRLPSPAARPTARPVARATAPAWHATGASFPQKQRAPALDDRSSATEMITLKLGDFLDRIPAELLDAGAHDRSAPMPFDLAALSERIGRGDTTIRLTEVYRRMPDVFRPDAVIAQERMIPFPWKSVLAMIQEAKTTGAEGGITRSGVETLARKFQSRKLRPNGKAADAVTVAMPRVRNAAAADAEEAGGLTASVATTSAAALEVARLKAELETALGRVAEFEAEYESMIARTGDLTAERDAATARVAELTAERDGAAARVAEPAAESEAAVARAKELTAERDAALARVTEITAERAAAESARITDLLAERDAAIARAEKLIADSEAAVALAAEMTAERDAAKAQIAAIIAEREAAEARAGEAKSACDAAKGRTGVLHGERDAALVRVKELTVERDVAAARVTELLQGGEQRAKSAAELPVPSDASVALEGYRNTIEALQRERDALRAELHAVTGRPAQKTPAAVPSAGEETPRPARTAEPLPDVYSSLFPQGLWLPRAVGAVALALLGLAIFSQLVPESAPDAPPAGLAAPASSAPETDGLPELTPAPLTDTGLTLEAPAEEAMTFPPQAALTGEAQENQPGNPNQIEWKPITSRRAR